MEHTLKPGIMPLSPEESKFMKGRYKGIFVTMAGAERLQAFRHLSPYLRLS